MATLRRKDRETHLREFTQNILERVNVDRKKFRKLYKKDVEEIMKAIVEELESQTRSGYTVKWRGFGVFEPSLFDRASHYNVKTGQKEKLPMRVSLKFLPSRHFKDKLNDHH